MVSPDALTQRCIWLLRQDPWSRKSLVTHSLSPKRNNIHTWHQGTSGQSLSRLKLCDFGISSSLKSTSLNDKSSARLHSMHETVWYASPQVNCGIGKVICGSCSKRNMRVPGRLRLQRVCVVCEKQCEDCPSAARTCGLRYDNVHGSRAPEQISRMCFPIKNDWCVVIWCGTMDMAERCTRWRFGLESVRIGFFYTETFSYFLSHTHTHSYGVHERTN